MRGLSRRGWIYWPLVLSLFPLARVRSPLPTVLPVGSVSEPSTVISETRIASIPPRLTSTPGHTHLRTGLGPLALLILRTCAAGRAGLLSRFRTRKRPGTRRNVRRTDRCPLSDRRPSERIVMGGIGLGGRGSYDLGVMLWPKGCAVGGRLRPRERAARGGQKHRRCDNALRQLKDCAMYGDLRQLLAERTDVEAVLIATGDRWHALASVWAMQAGKDVYCEKPACLTMAQGQLVVETARRYGRVFQTGAQRLSEPHHVFAIEMARSGRLGPSIPPTPTVRWRDGMRRDWLPAEPEPPRDELDWDAWIGPCPWRPFNKGYLGGGWYHFHDFATDVAMWGAHTVAQALAGLDMEKVTSIEFEYAGPDATMVTRFPTG
jgi:hypothetical protein